MARVTGAAWTADENGATVEAYFQFWLGDPGEWVTKVDVYRALNLRFPTRSAKAFKFKCQNIGGALYLDGLQFMPGLLPRVNVQKSLVHIIRDYQREARPEGVDPAPWKASGSR